MRKKGRPIGGKESRPVRFSISWLYFKSKLVEMKRHNFLHRDGTLFYISDRVAILIILTRTNSIDAVTPNSVHPILESPPRRRLPILLRRAWFSLNQAFSRRVSPAGVTPDQFTVLRTLSESEPDGLSQSDVTHLMRRGP